LIRCVAFDLGGVLIPSTPSFDYFQVEHNITPAHFGEFFRGTYDLAMRGKVDLFEILPPVLERWKWNGSVEEFASAWFHSCAAADPVAAEIVRAVREHGVICYAASNQDNRRAAFLDSQAWLQALFDRRFYSCHMRVKKPNADYFDFIQREAALLPQEILFVDDKIENVESARGCGWFAEVCRGASELQEIMVQYLPDLPLSKNALSGRNFGGCPGR
jgi:putative hydrolase of the HAD superfamily